MRIKNRALAASFVLSALTTQAQANLVSIDFNDLTHGVDVTDQYDGVHFELDGLPGEGPVAYALKDGDPSNTGNPVTVLGIADGLAITPYNPAPGFRSNCLPCIDFSITFDAPINYFSLLALDAEEAFTATAYNGNQLVASVNQGNFLGNHSGSVFNGPVYQVVFGAIDGLSVFDRVFFDINNSGNPGPEVYDNLQYNTIPEPDSYALTLTGLGIMGWVVRRKKSRHSEHNDCLNRTGKSCHA